METVLYLTDLDGTLLDRNAALPAPDAEKMRPGEPFTLTQKHAHAWAEYYIDGIGWLPFECTPGYIDDDDRFGSDDTSPDRQFISESFGKNERTGQD